ncbi:Methionine synthase (5-methyltetrahydrofolate--homocysteine methyltransferase) [Mucor velutinosus]|uniref:Methionine synthase (5-methyltetrahydrofolate--homocysteine methyltransferase) n=1 Tax=Mucor velutinosus TaxID=708070 RepID=A0AAN7DBP2_9FUNG|nr:Methionine synthase (5-methyltetrahydrofolate--homocysteine methyltransferase) [Mucor velutinosus]
MGLLDKIKSSYDYYKVDKYTRRRVSQSQFESHDRRYYESIYRDGAYLSPDETSYCDTTATTSHLSYKQKGWVLPDLLKKSNRKSLVSKSQMKTSETYTLGRA